MASAIGARASAEELQALAIREGMVAMVADGIRRAAHGEVSLRKVLDTFS